MSDDINSAIERIDWQCEVFGKITTDAQSEAWHHAYASGDTIEVGGRRCVVESFQSQRERKINGTAMEFWATLREPRP